MVSGCGSRRRPRPRLARARAPARGPAAGPRADHSHWHAGSRRALARRWGGTGIMPVIATWPAALLALMMTG